MLATDLTFAGLMRAAVLLAALCTGLCPFVAAAQDTTPRVDRLPMPAAPQAADISAIASGYEAQTTNRGLGMPPSSSVLILVSFSMPRASLVRLADQARRTGAVLVLNGLKDGSLTATARAVHQIFGKQGAPLQIDPRLFSRYAVSSVPTFVLLRPGLDEQSCLGDACSAGSFVKASGDVTLRYALEQIANADPAWQPITKALLRRLGD